MFPGGFVFGLAWHVQIGLALASGHAERARNVFGPPFTIFRACVNEGPVVCDGLGTPLSIGGFSKSVVKQVPRL